MTSPEDKNNNDDEIIIVSKSEQKRAAQDIEGLGQILIELNNKKLDKLPLNDLLRESIDTAKRIKVGNALKRQMRYIGKLIRKADYEAIEAAIEEFKKDDLSRDAISLQAEKWRDKALEDSHSMCNQFIDSYPECNRQKLNQLIRAANKEQATNLNTENKSNKQKSALFKYLRQVLAEAPQ